ncbi:MAG: Methionyl-tRNA formyltransferase [Chroococcopsis gigantea SAG 12.99]|jgi:methionyl-tRNA formyltransferase|nr:methionyl-tRNA formyltransferase [Chlorogloea purpurea SAG 13.99]MDV3000405.1 Methionyl-tRNA formyltransferase [Chroococcopsis gigantea SAG 12.99]
MKIVFFGTPSFAVPGLNKLLGQSDIEVIGVVTQPDKRRGRGNQLTPSPVKKIALDHNLTVWQPKRVKKDTATLSLLKDSCADAFVVVAYGQILSKEILEMPRLGCINVHGSILPQYRGAAPIQWCIYNGETQTGITTMLMNEGMDTGPMLMKAFTPISLMDNAHDIAAKLSHQGADLLIETLYKLDRSQITPSPQNDSSATYAPLIQKSDFEIHWHRRAIDIHNQIRGFYPNAVTSFRGQSLKVLATLPLESTDITPSENVGEVRGLLKNQGPVMQTGDGLLLLKEVQPAGKKAQSGGDFVNGLRVSIGEKLGG